MSHVVKWAVVPCTAFHVDVLGDPPPDPSWSGTRRKYIITCEI